MKWKGLSKAEGFVSFYFSGKWDENRECNFSELFQCRKSQKMNKVRGPKIELVVTFRASAQNNILDILL